MIGAKVTAQYGINQEMNYIVSIYQTTTSIVHRHNHLDMEAALARAKQAMNHPRVRKVEISLILHTLRK